MSAASETPETQRHILLVDPYGVLGTGVPPFWVVYDGVDDPLVRTRAIQGGSHEPSQF